MREIVLDTETTGLEPETGDRIVEIGAIELSGHMPTGRTYHQYINPQRTMPKEAFDIHGLGDDFLVDKPIFSQVAQDFIDFIGDAKLVIHNASFDMKFINAELSWCSKPPLPMDRAIDTLRLAKSKYPGSPASLDALCRRFGVDHSARTLHGALLDSEILAEVYLHLIGGRQPDFGLSIDTRNKTETPLETWTIPKRPRNLPSLLTDDEKARHTVFVSALGGGQS